MLDVALMSQIDRNDNNGNIPIPPVQVPDIREPVPPRLFSQTYRTTQESQSSRTQHRDINSMPTAPPESPYHSYSESPEPPTRPDPPRLDLYNTESLESMPSVGSSQHIPETQRFTRRAMEQSSASQRLTTLQMLREKKRQQSYQNPPLEMESPIYDHDRNPTPEMRSSREFDGFAPDIKEEHFSSIEHRRSKKVCYSFRFLVSSIYFIFITCVAETLYQ